MTFSLSFPGIKILKIAIPYKWNSDFLYNKSTFSETGRKHLHTPDICAFHGRPSSRYQVCMSEHSGKPVRYITEGKVHSAHFYAQRIQHQTAFLAMQNLHPVPRGIDKHEYISAAYVHPHIVVHYATQTIEPHTHVHRLVV